MLTADDIKIIKTIVTEAVAPLDTKLTKLDVKMSSQFAQLNEKTTKDTERLERAIKTEYKRGNEDFGHLKNEDRKISLRVAKIEDHLGFATV